MAIQYVNASSGTNTLILPAHQTGDVIVLFAYRDGSTTAPTVPTGQNWTTASSGGDGNTNSSLIVYKVAANSSEGVGTFTNATACIANVYRYAIGVGAQAQANGSSTTVSMPALTMQVTGGSSWVAGFFGHRSTNVSGGFFVGMASRASFGDATNVASSHDTNGGVTSWSLVTSSVGGTASGWSARTIEILADITPPSATFTPASGATGVTLAPKITIEFGEEILRGSGTVTVRSGSASGTILASINVNDNSKATFNATSLELTLTSFLPTNTTIFVVIPSGTLTDLAGNAWGGTSTYSFTTGSAVTFPGSPTTNQVYIFGERSWKYDGQGWVRQISYAAD